MPQAIPRGVWLAASVLALGGFLGNMDGPIVAVGLETMRVDLHSSLGQIQWVVTAYLLGLSAVLPLTARLIRWCGAGRLWLGALAGFLLTSALCALAPDVAALIAARALQGMTAGVMVAAGQTVIGLLVGPGRLGRVMGTLGLVVGLAPVAGPSVGGLLLQWFSWPAVFWLNLPIGAVTLLLGARLVPKGERQAPPPMDWTGLALVSGGVPLLVFACTELGVPGNREVLPYLALAALGLLAIVLFARRSSRRENPVLALRLLARPLISSSLLSVLFSSAGMFGAVLLLPLWFQTGLGQGSASTGLLLIPMGLGTTAIMAFAGRLTDTFGGGVVALCGSLLVLLSTVPFPMFDAHTPMVLIQALLVVRGIGLGLSMMPAMTVAYAAVSPAELGDATALANIIMRFGGALGGACCAIVLARALAAGPAGGFTAAFGALAVLCALATMASAALYRIQRKAVNP